VTLPAPRRCPRWHRDDGGFAMITVISAMFALSLIVTAALAYATGQLGNARHEQDWQAAAAAAQAGVDDYLQRLNTCDSYWDTPCANSPPDGAKAPSWSTIPGTSGNSSAYYQYSLISTPATTPGLIQLLIRGQVRGRKTVTRTFTAELRKDSFLKYIYYTDKETTDPALYPSLFPSVVQVDNRGTGITSDDIYRLYDAVQASVAQTYCARHHYRTATTPERTTYPRTYRYSNPGSPGSYPNGPRTENANCNEIRFVTGDTIAGQLHTNDAILLDGSPRFSNETTTSWPAGSTPAPRPTRWWWAQTGGTDGPPLGIKPSFRNPINLPPDNKDIEHETDPAYGGVGCRYTGPTRIVLNGNGTMTVTSPYTKVINSGCGSPGSLGSPQTLPLPANGVVYVQAIPASASNPNYSNLTCTNAAGSILGSYPRSGEHVVVPYDCRAGDVYLEGTLKGKLTIAAAGNVTITEDVRYAGGRTGTDVLGLVANNYVQIYHPVRCPTSSCSSANSYDNMLSGLNDIEVNAAMLSVGHSVTVQNYQLGDRLGKFTVFGGIYQAFRGAVGTGGSGSGTGYVKDYVYDNKLVSLPPPHFLNPVSAAWSAGNFGEQQN
jgi:hypothetical protein